MVTYNAAKGKVYALLKDQAKSDDILKAAFHGHVLLHSIRSSVKKQVSLGKDEESDAFNFTETPMDINARVAESCKVVLATYELFKDKAAQELKSFYRRRWQCFLQESCTSCSVKRCNTSLLIDYRQPNGKKNYILIDVGKIFREQ